LLYSSSPISRLFSSKINYRHLGIALLLGCIGFIINLYPIPLFANVQLVMGNTATVIIAILLGPWYALMTALIAVSGLMLVWDSPHVYLIFTLEAIVIGLARRRDIYALYASAAYWLLLGAPLFYLYSSVILNYPSDQLPFTVIKQVINGLICASLASIITLLVPFLRNLDGKITDKKRRAFNVQLTYGITSLVTLCLLLSSLISSYYSLERQQILIKDSLEETAEHIADVTEKYLDNHIKVIKNAAEQLTLSETKPKNWQSWLSTLHSNYLSFSTLIVANQQAMVVAATPEALFQEVQASNVLASIADREYFKQAFYNQKVFVSSAFLGRGFGNDPIVAISAPFYASDKVTQDSVPLGIIEGSLDLLHFNAIDNRNSFKEMQGIVILDNKEQVVYSSATLKQPLLSHFEYNKSTASFETKLDLINIHDKNAYTPEYIYSSRTLAYGWKVFVLDPFSPLLAVAKNQLLHSFLLLLASLIITFVITRKLSNLLTEPLTIIANQFGQLEDNNLKDQLINKGTPKEVYGLYQHLIEGKRQLIAHQLDLEETVATRTQELEEANKKLLVLVDRDPLTGLYNRRFAENKFAELREFCQRSGQAITIAILDLDFFKNVNDSYGHQAGDQCLKVVALALSKHFIRDTDIVARFGGEEFILILPMSNALNIEQHLNAFRVSLGDTIINSPQDHQTFSVTVSIGAITANADYDKSLDHWLKVADDNLYKVKEQGRNNVIVSLIGDAPKALDAVDKVKIT
jgi:diguanylate cyclase (GGDEF)-like protein